MKAALAYSNTDRQTAVMVSNSVELIILLYDKLLMRLDQVKRGFETKDISARAEALTKSIELIEVGLISSLDYRQGGEVAERLKAHYDIWIAKLFQANMKASMHPVSEVEQEVRVLKMAWDEIVNMKSQV